MEKGIGQRTLERSAWVGLRTLATIAVGYAVIHTPHGTEPPQSPPAVTAEPFGAYGSGSRPISNESIASVGITVGDGSLSDEGGSIHSWNTNQVSINFNPQSSESGGAAVEPEPVPTSSSGGGYVPHNPYLVGPR